MQSMDKEVYRKFFHHKNNIRCSYNPYGLQTLCRRDSKSITCSITLIMENTLYVINNSCKPINSQLVLIKNHNSKS